MDTIKANVKRSLNKPVKIYSFNFIYFIKKKPSINLNVLNSTEMITLSPKYFVVLQVLNKYQVNIYFSLATILFFNKAFFFNLLNEKVWVN